MAALTAIVAAAAVASAGASIFGGIQANKEGEKQARFAESQAANAAAETKRQTDRSLKIEGRNIKETQDRQRLAYLASGVTLEGSPLLKLEETRRLGAENLDEIEKSGSARSEAQVTEGRLTADRAKSAGRQGLINGITGAAGSLSRLA